MQTLTTYEKRVFLLLAIFYLVGIILHLVPATLPLMLLFTPYTLLATAVIGFFSDRRNKLLLIWALVTFLSTLTLEILGVQTGLVFGSYGYGQTLGVQLLGVPLMIGINWTIIILGAITIIEKIVHHPILVAFITASFTVFFDWIMEPVAIAFDYWSWDGVAIPLQNYIAWFAIAFLFALLHQKMKVLPKNRVASIILLIQTVFFASLRLFAV